LLGHFSYPISPTFLFDDYVDVAIPFTSVVMAIDPSIREIADFDVCCALRHSFVMVVFILWAMLRRGIVFLNYYDFILVLVLVLVLVMSMSITMGKGAETCRTQHD
jgi:hypothetical protein